MNEPLSHVDYLALNVQALLDERFAGKATRLGKHAQMNPKAIRRVLAGQPCRLQTVDKLAQTCGMAVGEMFLKPGTQICIISRRIYCLRFRKQAKLFTM